MRRKLSQKKTALLIFCEGPHDVAFVRLVFKYCFNVSKVEWKFSEYPAPFNALFQKSVETHAARDLSLDMAHKFFLPDSVLNDDDRIVLLFNSGGKDKTDKVKEFLRDFIPLLEQSSTFSGGADAIVSEVKYLLLYDADDQSVGAVLSWIAEKFKSIEEQKTEEIEGSEKATWAMDKLERLDENSSGAIGGDKAAYVWARQSAMGTLEDILYPMFAKQAALMGDATDFVDNSFQWDTDNPSPKTAIAQTAKRLKAIFTVMGQRKKPGGSMNVILDQGKLISRRTFEDDENVERFVWFLNRFFMGREDNQA